MGTITKGFLFLAGCSAALARIHNLKIENDERKDIALSVFGFYQGGRLEVNLYNFTFNRKIPESDPGIFGFSLDRTINDAMSNGFRPQEECILDKPISIPDTNYGEFIYFILDLKNKVLQVKCGDQRYTPVHIYNREQHNMTAVGENNSCEGLNFSMSSTIMNRRAYYDVSFIVAIETPKEEGLYNLYFHNCPNYNSGPKVGVDFDIEIIESNVEMTKSDLNIAKLNTTYRSVKEMRLPTIYCLMSVLFFLSGMFWVFILDRSEYPVFGIHHMMTVLVFFQAASVAFRGVNYYIERLGRGLPIWTILFMITHLLKGVLLIVLVLLLGTGWKFIKEHLTPRDKIFCMAAVLLQILAYVAVNSATMEGKSSWINVVYDLLIGISILLPTIWTIRDLKKSSKSSAAKSLRKSKLKLFEFFFVIIVFYLFVTRVIIYLFRVTIPLEYSWLNQLFQQIATYMFFVLTAYTFRPALQYNIVEEEMENMLSTAEKNKSNQVNKKFTYLP